MSRGCIAFLATVIEVPTAALGLKGISIVREFPGVIPLELTTMPPDMKIEFVIDVVLGTAPILGAPYWMAQVQLRADSTVTEFDGLGL